MVKKDPAAVKLGRKGGLAKNEKWTAAQRSESARHVVLLRWAQKKKAQR